MMTVQLVRESIYGVMLQVMLLNNKVYYYEGYLIVSIETWLQNLGISMPNYL